MPHCKELFDVSSVTQFSFQVLSLVVFLPTDVLAQAWSELEVLGGKVLDQQVFEWTAEAETNLPYVIEKDLFGHPINKLVTSSGWKNLKNMGIREG